MTKITVTEFDGGAVKDIYEAWTICPRKWSGDCVCHKDGKRIPLRRYATKPDLIDRAALSVSYNNILLVNGDPVRHVLVNSSRHLPVVFITDNGGYVLDSRWTVTLDDA